MDETRPASNGQERRAEASDTVGLPGALPSVALAAPFLLLAVENTQTMLKMQRDLADLGREVVRQQQDAMMAAMLRGFGVGAGQDRAPAQDGIAGLAQFGFAAFERMAAALRAANDASRWTGMRGTGAGPR